MNLRLEAGNIFDNDLMVVLFIVQWFNWLETTNLNQMHDHIFLRAGCEYRQKSKTGENKDIEDSEKDDRDS